ncbi:GGDEF domain-containing protein [Arthrobacter sp. 35W]|uniref:GGDEF domain-containing protein n=1 Tax=Arthrobacter sp. 35W TaxID=1132441 RepID=UPI000408602A|nr:GGDEF domain-containing protein [Arthrobacter sp. 35W]
MASAICSLYFLTRAVALGALGHDAVAGIMIFGPGAGTSLALLLLIVVTFSMASLSSEQRLRILKTQAAHDGLTGLLTRTEFLKQARMRMRLQAAAGSGTPATLVIADLDRFKSIHDTLGHGAGDKVIEAFAAACRESVRSTDLIGRHGGEEFRLLVTGADADGAARIASGINQRLCQAPFDGGSVTPVSPMWWRAGLNRSWIRPPPAECGRSPRGGGGVPIDVFSDGNFEVVDAHPRPLVADQFSLEQRVLRLGQPLGLADGPVHFDPVHRHAGGP